MIRTRRFSADASHELKTPLALLRLHAEKLVTEGSLSAEHEEVVVVMLDELARLNRVIDELLFLSRAEAKAITARTVPQDPSHFLENFDQDAVVLAEHQGKRFVHVHSGKGQVAFEEGLLRQVLLNLLANALNASPQGGMVGLRSEFEPNLWRVSIEDEGPGLSAEQRELMFERFVRFARVHEEKPGTGLGLAICRTIVGLHGGKIFACGRKDGKGLRVVVELPAQIISQIDDPVAYGQPINEASPRTPSVAV